MVVKKVSHKKSSSKKNNKNQIHIHNARVNNLKNVSVDIPRDKMTVVTGLSGSGKSSLAFDVIYAESNRRFMESLSTHARSLMGVMTKPDVDRIENISPAIAIDQKSVGKSIRSTVGTMTEIYDYMRVLFAAVGVPHCPHTSRPLKRKSTRDIVAQIMKSREGSKITVLAPMSNEDKKNSSILKSIKQSGYARVRFNNKIMSVVDATLIVSDETSVRIDIVIDRFVHKESDLDRECLMDSVETAMKLSGGLCVILYDDFEEEFSQDFYCKESGFVLSKITPRCFSFNNPDGACSECDGIGIKNEIDPSLLIPNDTLSIEEGAIHIWSKSGGKNTAFSKHKKTLEKLAKKYKFSLSKPVKKISKANLTVIFYGTSKGCDDEFKGIIFDLEERYKNTKSDYMRKELEKYMVERECSACKGRRLKNDYLSVTVNDRSIDEFVSVPLDEFVEMVSDIKNMESLHPEEKKSVDVLVDEMLSRARALCEVGVDYLTLSRSSNTLSGGEAQRIRLAVQIKSDLTGVIYVLDEPTTGLHSRDTVRLINAMKKLQSANNTLIVVEHDADVMREADWIVDMGPGAGDEGGELIFSGTLQQMLRAKTKTAKYIAGDLSVTDKKNKREGTGKSISIKGARENNLQNISVDFPLGVFMTVCGVSGSGKSTLVHSILSRVLAKEFHRATIEPGAHKRVTGLQNINKVIMIDQNPIGRTPRSNTATYTGVFSHIRELFASTDMAIERGFDASHFSFNMRGGRCEVCRGEGSVKVEMHLLPDMYVPCEECGGSRYSSKILDVEYNGVTIADVLDMGVDYAYEFFKSHSLIAAKLHAMQDVGLGYIQLGQSATNLSGGEAQRIKLATELARKSTGKTLYILDEPTTGLHFDDVKKLLKMLDALVDKGNTVLVVEHNADVINHSDWVIELGPEGGALGGNVIFEGKPSALKKHKKSPTAKFL
ncbi:MAG: excinuclease ABC subunit UvrA [Clostridiales bacterium]|nr:excinuclease ABC subunit UvrA [Clostridiales bacterium]